MASRPLPHPLTASSPACQPPLLRGIPAPPRSAVVASRRTCPTPTLAAGEGASGKPCRGCGASRTVSPPPARGRHARRREAGWRHAGPGEMGAECRPRPLGGEAQHCVVSAVTALMHSVPAGQPRGLAWSLGYLAAAGWPCGQARQTGWPQQMGHVPRGRPSQSVSGDVVWCSGTSLHGALLVAGLGREPRLGPLRDAGTACSSTLSIVLWNLPARVPTGLPHGTRSLLGSQTEVGTPPKSQPAGSRRSRGSVSSEPVGGMCIWREQGVLGQVFSEPQPRPAM